MGRLEDAKYLVVVWCVIRNINFDIHQTTMADAGLQMGPGVAIPATGTATGQGMGLGYKKASMSSTNKKTQPMISIAYMYLPTLAEHVLLGAYPFQNMTEPTMSQVNLQMMKKTWKPSQLPQTQASSGQFQAIPPMMKKMMMKARIMQPSTCSQAEREIWMRVPGGGLTSTQVLSLYAQQRSTTRKGKNMTKKMMAYQVRKVFQGQQLGLIPPYTVLVANIQIFIYCSTYQTPLQRQQLQQHIPIEAQITNQETRICILQVKVHHLERGVDHEGEKGITQCPPSCPTPPCCLPCPSLLCFFNTGLIQLIRTY